MIKFESPKNAVSPGRRIHVMKRTNIVEARDSPCLQLNDMTFKELCGTDKSRKTSTEMGLSERTDVYVCAWKVWSSQWWNPYYRQYNTRMTT